MPQFPFSRTNYFRIFLVVCALVYFTAPTVVAQGTDDLDNLKATVRKLTKEFKYAEATPLVEKLIAKEPNNAEAHFLMGFCLIGTGNTVKDAGERKALRARSREEFVKAKTLGYEDPLVDALIASLPEDGRDAPAYSQNIRANALMVEGESQFAQGKLDDALKTYKAALEVDPKLYHAALFAGDVYTQRGDFTNAEIWYQKAIDIDPTIETAYRYSATPLMKMGKPDEARERYFEAYITEPYNKFALSGLLNWAKATETPLRHPDIEIPTDVTYDENGKININLGTSVLGDAKDGSSAWMLYGITRSSWYSEKFAKMYPGEKYRHSLAEEVDALRMVINSAVADKKVKTLNPSIAMLKKLNDDGLLEAWILLARPDAGIAQDHPAYLKAHRDRLKRYMKEYVLPHSNGGNPPSTAG